MKVHNTRPYFARRAAWSHYRAVVIRCAGIKNVVMVFAKFVVNRFQDGIAIEHDDEYSIFAICSPYISEDTRILEPGLYLFKLA
jgi:hypothetical protein